MYTPACSIFPSHRPDTTVFIHQCFLSHFICLSLLCVLVWHKWGLKCVWAGSMYAGHVLLKSARAELTPCVCVSMCVCTYMRKLGFMFPIWLSYYYNCIKAPHIYRTWLPYSSVCVCVCVCVYFDKQSSQSLLCMHQFVWVGLIS